MKDIRDYTRDFNDFLYHKFSKSNLDLGLHNLPNGIPSVTGEGSDTAIIGTYSYGISNKKSVEFSFCFYTHRRTKDAILHVHLTSSTALKLEDIAESGLLKRINEEQNAEGYTLEYKFKKDLQQISPDTLNGEIWSSIFKNIFMQIQSIQ